MTDPITYLQILSRWVHVGTAIVILGGSVFMRFVLMPAAQPLPETEHNALRERLLGRWKLFVHIGVLLFLVTGFYNYLAVSVPRLADDPQLADKKGLYHGLMGVKIILSVAVFFLAEALVGRSAALEGFRRDRRKWLGVTVLLAALVVAIAGALKVLVK
ncbi:MAG TPA: hypothetical protein VML55_12515 [Planctomycetaceae bacterium]|nr:hypothetical protein [Planctomycetaceae bacterium]